MFNINNQKKKPTIKGDKKHSKFFYPIAMDRVWKSNMTNLMTKAWRHRVNVSGLIVYETHVCAQNWESRHSFEDCGHLRNSWFHKFRITSLQFVRTKRRRKKWISNVKLFTATEQTMRVWKIHMKSKCNREVCSHFKYHYQNQSNCRFRIRFRFDPMRLHAGTQRKRIVLSAVLLPSLSAKCKRVPMLTNKNTSERIQEMCMDFAYFYSIQFCIFPLASFCCPRPIRFVVCNSNSNNMK